MRGPIARATLRTTAVLGLRVAVQAGTLLLIARLLGPKDYGAFAGVAALAVMLGALSSFGMHLVLLSEVSREPERPAPILPAALATTLLCGSLLLGLYLLIALTFLRPSGIRLDVLVPLGITELLLQPLLNLPAWTDLGRGHVARSQLLGVFPLLLRSVVALALWWLQPANILRDYVVGSLFASIVALYVATLTVRGAWPAVREWRLPRWREWREGAGYAAPGITELAPSELDKSLATRLLPLEGAGIYSAGARIMGALTIPVVAMLVAALPRLFHHANKDALRARLLVRTIIVASVGYGFSLAVVLWWSAPFFGWLFGHQYAGLASAVRWLCIALPAMALRTAVGTILITLGRPWIRAVFEIIGLIVLIAAAMLLAPRYEIPGMALALACSEWIMAGIGLAWIYRSMHAGSVPAEMVH